MKTSSWVVAICVLLFIFMSFIWNLDISVSTLITEGAYMTNGWWEPDPMQFYHISLYGISIIFFAMVVFVIHHLKLDGERK